MHSSILSLTQELSIHSYDFIVNYWVCWYSNQESNMIQVVRTLEAYTNKELIVPVLFKFWELASCLCSEKIIYDDSLMQNIWFVDMESYAVEKVCDYFRIPRIILKVPVDRVWDETRNFNRDKACKLLQANIDFTLLTQKISKYLDSIVEPIDLSIYTSHLKFSVSEQVIFQKYFQAYCSLSKESFDLFFEKYSHLEKKEFLQNMKQHINSLRNLIW